RAAAKDVAEQLELTGWIRNTENGEVEAKVSGDEDRVREFITWCQKGPSRAAVSKVSVTEQAEEDFRGFRVIR
ncbi:MAG TPA: acylphosphatase, partial [Chitinophagaceae bacterium]